jgi:imidazolonepropionase-like amidohydrolase
MSEELGTIEPGKLADLIALAGDPLDDIRQLEDVRVVIKGGVVYGPDH